MSARRLLIAVLVPVLLWSTACSATGMGWIQSSNAPVDPNCTDPTTQFCTDKAVFGFKFDGTTSTLSGSYHDPQGSTDQFGVVDVAFKGTGVLNPCKAGDPLCVNAPADTKGGCLAGEPQYQSQNPKIRGGGDFFLLLCDLDGDGTAGTAGTDFIFLTVDTGPYTGYRNLGNPQGNITVKQ